MTTTAAQHTPRITRTLKIQPDRYAKVAARNGWDTNAAVARDLGLSETAVSRILSGKAAPNLQFVMALLDFDETAGFRRLFEIVTTVEGQEEVSTA